MLPIIFIFLFCSSFIAQSLHSFVPNFDSMMNMEQDNFYKKYSSEPNKSALVLLKNLYEQNHMSKLERSVDAKIPKIIHQIWVGSKPVPSSAQAFKQSWIDKHPGWEYKLWTKETVGEIIDLFTAEHKKIYEECNDPIEQANILRYYILYVYGGVYVDMDFRCLKSFEELHHYYDFYVGISTHDCKEIVCNALISATPGHAILKSIIENMHDIEKGNLNKNNRRYLRTGVHFFSKRVLQAIACTSGVNIAFPITVFYPTSYTDDVSTADSFIKPESMAMHYWASCTNAGWNDGKWNI